MAKGFHKVEVHNGEHTSFWFDDWCCLGRLRDVLGSRGYIALGITSAATLADVFVSHRVRRHRNPLLNQIEEEILKLKSQGHMTPDVSLWRCQENKYKKMFSTKNTWQQIRIVSPGTDWYKGVWFSKATPKYSFIVWLAVHNRLSTGDRMANWNGGASSSCVFCDHPTETRDHLFFSCPFISPLWRKLVVGITQTRFTTLFGEMMAAVSASDYTPSRQFILRYVFQTSIYMIWRERNRRRHGERPLPASQLLKHIDTSVRNRLSSFKSPEKLEDALREWFALRRL